jgi:hypothetical protein
MVLRCKFHNIVESKKISARSLALVANSSTDQDAQIAVHLQQTEERGSLAFLLEQARRQKQLSGTTPINQAAFLTDEVHNLLECFDHFEGLPWIDVRSHAMTFIVNMLDFGKCTKISIGYLFTSADRTTFNAVKTCGFRTNAKLGISKSIVRRVRANSADAWARYSDEKMKMTIGSLPPLSESNDFSTNAFKRSSRGWLVAIPGRAMKFACMQRDNEQGLETVDCSDYMLPLASFSAHLPNPTVVKPLEEMRLASACHEFFEIGLGLNPDADQNTWLDNFKEMETFYRFYGHCNIPYSSSFSKNPSWTRIQRMEFETIQSRFLRNLDTLYYLDKGDKYQWSHLDRFPIHDQRQVNEERAIMLTNIGFNWGYIADAKIATWEFLRDELRAFKDSRGHLHVLQDYTNKFVVQFVKGLMLQYALKNIDQPCYLPSEMIRFLNALGFQWQMDLHNEER